MAHGDGSLVVGGGARRPDNAYVAETDEQGISKASNLYAFLAASETKQTVRLVMKDTEAGMRKRAELVGMPGVETVEFDFEQF